MDVLFFWILLVGSSFSYFIYPALLIFVPRRRVSENLENYEQSELKARISLIVTAHNEAARIREKIENCLALDFQNLEIVVASDASTDETDKIVQEFASRDVKLVRAEERRGKEYAQLNAISRSTGDVIVFSDVATSIPKDALGLIVEYFKDPTVGAVSSEDRFISRDGRLVGEGAYVRYEMWLRGLESKRAGLVGLSGSFFAARRSVCEEWDVFSPSDFNTALNCARKGLLAVNAPDVLGVYQDVSDSSQEYARKVRTVIRGITALSRHTEVLNPFKFGAFSFQVFGHKVMRWLVPWFQVLLFLVSLIVAGEGLIYLLALMVQLTFYTCVLGGYVRPSLLVYSFVRIPYFFFQANLAIAQATIAFLRGRRMNVWAPSQR